MIAHRSTDTLIKFVKGQISEIVEQLKRPITGNHRMEAEALTAEMVGWMQKLRILEGMPV